MNYLLTFVVGSLLGFVGDSSLLLLSAIGMLIRLGSCPKVSEHVDDLVLIGFTRGH